MLPLACCAALALISLLFSATTAPANGSGPTLPQPGLRSIGIWHPDTEMRIDVAVWYPSPRAPRDVHLEGWALRVSKDNPGVPGKYPVILLSHDAASSRFASHDLAAALARHGFIVVAPTHPGDNALDSGGLYHAAIFADRPRHLLLALDAATRHPAIGPLLDRSRVGALGVGSGAATALQLAGAKPDLARLSGYCSSQGPRDPLCSNWAKGFHPRMQREFALLAAEDDALFTPFITREEQPLAANGSLSDLSGAVAQRDETPAPQPAGNAGTAEEDMQPPPEFVGPAAPPALRRQSSREQQLKPALEKQPLLAVGLLTPGYIGLFPDASLHGLAVPVGIFAALNDTVYPPEKTTKRLQDLLPRRPVSQVLRNVTHFDLQSPCPPVDQNAFAALCGGRTSSANEARKIRNDFFVRFFQKLLGPPLPPPVPPAVPQRSPS